MSAESVISGHEESSESLADKHKAELETLGRKLLDPVTYVCWYKAGADFTPLVRMEK